MMRKIVSLLLLLEYLIVSSPALLFAQDYVESKGKDRDEALVRSLIYSDQSRERKTVSSQALIKAKEGGSVELFGARVEIAAGVLKEDTLITIEALSDMKSTEDEGLDNATGSVRGFRFLPSGNFEGDVIVYLPYDLSLSGDRGKLDSMLTYFYDEESGRWRALERIGIDEEKGLLISKTNHFTDMINGTLTVPDVASSPQVNLNSIKSLEAAKADSHLIKFNAPEASNSAEGSFSFELGLPSGRGGMQPSLAVYYSSDAPNGFMGRGFDISYGSSVRVIRGEDCRIMTLMILTRLMVFC